jgi:ribosomal protein L30/L7E
VTRGARRSWDQRRTLRRAGALGLGSIDDGRFVAVLEVKSADVLELRRRGDENARCRTLLGRLELVLTRRLDLLQDGGVEVTSQVGIHRARVDGIRPDAVRGPVLRRADGEEHVRRLRLAVGDHRVIRAVSEIDVVEMRSPLWLH